MPFMVGALGNVFGDADAPSISPQPQIGSPVTTAADRRKLSNQEICDALHGSVDNAVKDDIQQLKYITSQLYGEDAVDDCFDLKGR